MRFLLDANISPLVAAWINDAGTRLSMSETFGLRDAPDERILEFAAREERVIVRGTPTSRTCSTIVGRQLRR